MTKKDLTNLQNAIGRTRMICEMDKNAIRRNAKLDALSLLVSDLSATFKTKL